MKSCVVFGFIFEFSLLFFFTVGFVFFMLSTAVAVATVVAVLAAFRGLFRFIAGSASMLATGRLLVFAGHWVCSSLRKSRVRFCQKGTNTRGIGFDRTFNDTVMMYLVNIT